MAIMWRLGNGFQELGAGLRCPDTWCGRIRKCERTVWTHAVVVAGIYADLFENFIRTTSLAALLVWRSGPEGGLTLDCVTYASIPPRPRVRTLLVPKLFSKKRMQEFFLLWLPPLFKPTLPGKGVAVR